MNCRVICCFPGVLKSNFIDVAENFYGKSVLDASTAEYAQNAFDTYRTELSGTQYLSCHVHAIEVDYYSEKYDFIFVPIMQSFVGRLEQLVPITVITLNKKDSDNIIKYGATFANRDLVKLYQECNGILRELEESPNIYIIELPEGERRIPHPDLLEYC